jgi:hypothetical protein
LRHRQRVGVFAPHLGIARHPRRRIDGLPKCIGSGVEAVAVELDARQQHPSAAIAGISREVQHELIPHRRSACARDCLERGRARVLPDQWMGIAKHRIETDGERRKPHAHGEGDACDRGPARRHALGREWRLI